MDTNHTAKARMHNFLYIQFNFERKVICLQACIRGYLLRLRLRRKEIQKSINLGSLIGFQACARGFLIRQQMKLKQKDEYKDILLLERLVTKNIIRLQAYTRGFLLRQRMRIEEQYKIGKQQEEECILHVMKSRHKQQLTEAIIHDFLYYEDIVARNIICLQACVRGYLLRLRQRKKASICLQACARGFLIRQQLKRENEYKNILVLQELVNKNIIRFQAYTRGYIVRHFREKKESIIKIQNAYRRYVCKNQYLQKIDACVKVQSMIRQYIARKHLRYVLKNAIKLQSYIAVWQKFM